MEINIQSYATLFLIWLISTLIVRAIVSKTRPTPRLPPSPVALPIIGHVHLLGSLPHQSFYKLAARYGPLLRIRLGSVPFVIACSADTAKDIFKTHEISFSARGLTSAAHHLSYDNRSFIFAPYGPYWKFIKKLTMSELLGGRTIETMLPIRRQELRRFLQLLMKSSEAGEAVDVSAELLMMTSNVISMMAMRKRCTRTEGEEDVQKLLTEVSELVGTFNLGDYNWVLKKLDVQGIERRYKDVHLKLDGVLEGIIKEHEQESQARRKMDAAAGDCAKDLLDIMLDISEDEKAEMKLTREDIKAFIQDIFVAGSDTSSITTEWALAELINHPTVLKKAREEVDAVVGKERLVEESDTPNLPYIQAIVKETLRLHPPSPMISRKAINNSEVSGYYVPSGTHIFINVWAIGRDPKYWEDPLEFRPERFMPSDGKNHIDIRGQHYHLVPFGSGRRGCPGITLSMQLIQTTVASIVQSFELKINNSEDGEGNICVDMTERAGQTIPKAEPLVCFPVARISPLLLQDPTSE